MSDWLLACWICAAFAFDVFLIGGCAYMVFWRGHSGLWFIAAVYIGSSPTLYKVLRKRFGVEEKAK